MMIVALVFGLVGSFSIVGGLMGFKKAGSRASLIAGGTSGLFLLAAAGLVSGGITLAGLALGGGVSALLLSRFLPAYFKTKKVMPQLVMSLLSLLGLAAALWGYTLR